MSEVCSELVEIAWLAGLYEGEGSCYGGNGTLHLSIKMADLDVLERAREIAGCGLVHGPYTRGPAHWKPMWQFRIHRDEQALAVATRIRPFLMSRRVVQLDAAIERWRESRARLPDDTDRFWAKVHEKGECLIWSGAVQGGYGRVWVEGPRSDPTLTKETRSGRKPKQDLAHRVAWRMAGHDLPARVNLRNRCGSTTCVRPEHWVRADSICTRGHVLTDDNVVYAKNGKYIKRSCKTCCRASSLQAKEKTRGT